MTLHDDKANHPLERLCDRTLKYDVLLYDLTSTHFEGEAEENSKAQRSYSRDHRPDCKQVVIALVVTPEGFPLGYEILPGNTQDTQTLSGCIERIRPIYHQMEARVDAHIFVCFQAYCLCVTLRHWLRPLASGLTPRQALDQFAKVQMLDVEFPTTNGHTLRMSRYTQPDDALKLLMFRMRNKVGLVTRRRARLQECARSMSFLQV